MGILQELYERCSQEGYMDKPITDLDFEKLKIKTFNDDVGTLEGYDCSVCKNKGFVAFLGKENVMAVTQCKCQATRTALQRIEQSGLKDIISKCKLNDYIATEKWQQDIKKAAIKYVDDCDSKWFFIGGAVGSGKTHICTGIVRELIKRNRNALYMLWRDEIVALKANVNDYKEYAERMDKLKKADVLYIDDFFKVEKGKQPTTADVNIAFEILNYRYNSKLTTIISSEFVINDILEIDEAVGSRIVQKSDGYRIDIAPDRRKNYRLKGVKL